MFYNYTACQSQPWNSFPGSWIWVMPFFPCHAVIERVIFMDRNLGLGAVTFGPVTANGDIDDTMSWKLLESLDTIRHLKTLPSCVPKTETGTADFPNNTAAEAFFEQYVKTATKQQNNNKQRHNTLPQNASFLC